MKNIKDLTVTQIRIFAPDYIPYVYLMRPDFIDHMKQKFHFQKQEIPIEQFQRGQLTILLFNGGDFTFEGKKILIQRLHFDNRRIVLEAMTSSTIASKIFDSVAKEIRNFDPIKSFRQKEAVFATEETSCIAKLEVNYDKVYSKAFTKFISDSFLPLLEQKFLEIRPKSLSFEVHFDPDNEYSKKHNIALVPKTLTIEPRAGHALDEKLFFTHSPFNSDTHFKLLEAFEKTFSA